jgi:ABC-2 type transport system ATP-binding protein
MVKDRSESMIEAEGLTKRYGAFAAVDGVTFSVPGGQVVAFLGANGAGKTTTMRLLTGFLAPTSGRALVAGEDMSRTRLAGARRLGYLPENGPLYPDMTPRMLLRFFGEARGLGGGRLSSRMEEVVNRFAIGSVLDKPIRKLSRGYRQRVGMAQALLHDPDVLILDEPTSGLDPNQILEARKTIRELAQKKTILLSTHILQEVEAVADRVMLIHRGRIVYDGLPQSMTRAGETLEKAFYRLTG